MNGAVLAGMAGGAMAAGVDIFGRLEPSAAEVQTKKVDQRSFAGGSLGMSVTTAVTDSARNRLL